MFITFSIYIEPITPNCCNISGLLSTFAPLSISIKQSFVLGSTGANPGRFIPFIRLTIKVAPTVNPPLFPAEIKASPLPAANSFSPTAIDVSLLLLIISVGVSSIVNTSVQLIISNPVISIAFSSATFLIILSFPTNTILSILYSFLASTVPFKISKGALSPPIASTINFIITPHQFIAINFVFFLKHYS